MYKPKEHKSIKEEILATIKKGQISMKPRWSFILQTTLVIGGIVILLLTLFYIISFIIFTFHNSGLEFIYIFGSRGWQEFFTSLPWLLIIFSLIFIIVLEILVRKFSFGYRQPLLFSAIFIICITSAGGILISQTSFHKTMMQRLENSNVEFAKRFYKNFGIQKSETVKMGTIIDLAEDGFMMQNQSDEIIHVLITPQTLFPSGLDFTEGNTVIVLGNQNIGLFQALGIRKIDEEFGPKNPRKNKHRPLFPSLFKQNRK